MTKKTFLRVANIPKQDLEVLESVRKGYKITWGEVFHQLSTYPELFEQALKLPPEISNNMAVDVTTLHALMPMWMGNIRENFDDIKNGLDVIDIPKTNLPAIIVGAGPSLHQNNHLAMLADSGFDGIVFAADRALKDCIEAGVIPDYVCILDGSEKILPYIDHRIVDDHAEQMSAIMCVTTHPKVANRWKGEKYWFTNSISQDFAPNVAFILHHLLEKTELVTAGHASSLGWSVAHTMGCRELVLIGVDLSYKIETPVNKTAHYDSYARVCKSDREIRKMYKKYHHDFFNTDCYFDPVFDSYRDCSLAQFADASKMGCRVINCTGGGSLSGDGLECMWFADFLDGRKV